MQYIDYNSILDIIILNIDILWLSEEHKHKTQNTEENTKKKIVSN